MRLPSSIALVTLLALAPTGCERKPLEVARRELPGLSIELPSSSQLRTLHAQLDYRNGDLALAGDAGGAVVVIVQWSAGTKLNDDELHLVLGALGTTLGGRPSTVTGVVGGDGKPVDTLRFDADGVALSISQVECGGRNVLIASAIARAPAAEHRRLVASLRCHPDPAAEATLATTVVPLALVLPGWYAVSRDGNQLQLSDGASFLMLQPMPATTPDRLVEAIGPVLEGAFKGAVKPGAQQGDRVALSGMIDGQAIVGWARLVTCPTSKILVFEMSPDQPRADRVEQAVTSAACVAPGEAPSWPDPPR
jgi:hypothetical protein